MESELLSIFAGSGTNLLGSLAPRDFQLFLPLMQFRRRLLMPLKYCLSSASIGNARLAGLEQDLNMTEGDYALALSESSGNPYRACPSFYHLII